MARGRPCRIWLAGLILGVVVLAACSTATPDQSMPDLKISVYQGQAVLGGGETTMRRLLAQDKPVVLNFWAGACAPCRKEMPEFQRVYDRYKEQVLVLGIDIGPFVGLGTREQGKALLRDLDISYPAGTTLDPAMLNSYEIVGMPTTLFITPKGQVIRRWAGILDEAKLGELVEELLVASGKA